MTRLIAVLAVAASLVVALTSTAQGYLERPPIGQGQAEHRVFKLLHSKREWRHRKVGYVDCRHGRINNYTWACAVGWATGPYNCWLGRVQVTNKYVENGATAYDIHLNARPC